MSQLPTVSQPNPKTSSNDGQAVDRSRSPSTSSEAARRISSAPQIATSRPHNELLPSVQSIQDRAVQPSGVGVRFHSILNPSDTSHQPTSQRDSQRAFLQSSIAREMSPETTGSYREEPQHPRFSRLSSTLSSPRPFRGLLHTGHGQDPRTELAQSHNQQAPSATEFATSNLNRLTPAPNTMHHPRYGPTHQASQSSYPVYTPYSPLSVALRPTQLSGYHENQVPARSHLPVSDVSPRQTPSGPVHASFDTLSSQEQNSYHMMTLETEQGQIPIRVDVEAASRVADEKRRRNATASARFRARRKEKEHANSQEIEDLRREIQELTEDAAFYRQERDYLATAVLRTPQGERHFPRPLSPRQRRAQSQHEEMSIAPSGIGPPRYDTYQELGERGREGRHTRRRVSTETQYITPPIASAASAYPSQQPYNQQAYGQPIQSRIIPSSQPPSSQNSFLHSPPQIQQRYPPRSVPYKYPSEGGAKPP